MTRAVGALRAWARSLDPLAARAGGEDPARPPWRAFVAAAAIGAATFGAVAHWNSAAGDLVDEALSPIARLGAFDVDDDDGSTAAPSADGSDLPLPELLQDANVVAALAPLARLSCRSGEYGARPVGHAAPTPAEYAAARTGGSGYPGRERASPASIPTPASEAGALLTGNLLGAGFSPVALLPAASTAARSAAAATVPAEHAACPALLRHTFNRLQTGEPQSLCQFQGKVLLIVNTASYCAYTKQYEGLEALHRKYAKRGLVVVGFPSNDFGSQEPGTNGEIAAFCRTTYGVRFPMFEKSSVSRLDANPLYAELATRTGTTPGWNFHKYVVDRSGTRVASFASEVTPDARSLVDLIERWLAEAPEGGRG